MCDLNWIHFPKSSHIATYVPTMCLGNITNSWLVMLMKYYLHVCSDACSSRTPCVVVSYVLYIAGNNGGNYIWQKCTTIGIS